MLSFFRPLLLLCVAAVAAVGQTGRRASLLLPQQENVSVVIENDGDLAIQLLNCEQSLLVPAGEKLNVTLSGQSGYWVVPEGKLWGCEAGPFNFYYLQSSFSKNGTKMSVGFGLDDRSREEIAEEEQQQELFNISGTNASSRQDSSAKTASGILGVKLVAAAIEDSNVSVACTEEACESDKNVTTVPESFRLILSTKSEDYSLRGSFAQSSSSSGLWGWAAGGDKVWGSGSGVESIDSRNVGYYNRGMQAARSHCGGAGCALIVNPPGHRTVNYFHIHFVHYAGWGAKLHSKLESRVCKKSGWHRGGLPCHGKAAFFPGFPAVFSVAGGSVHHASVIAWPGSCGGRGTIVELAYGCSIEHQIRGDYNPALR